MMTAIKEFTDNPKNSKSPFVTSKDCGDSMTKWLIREFRDYSISQDGMRDRVIKVLREVNKKHSDTFDIEVTYSSKWFFDNKKEIDDFVMSIFSNHIINGWLVSYD